MATYQQALEAYKAGRPIEARLLCAQALATEPEAPERLQLLHLDGVLAREIGDVGLALERFDEVERLLLEVPDQAAKMTGMLAYNRGLTLWQCRRSTDALAQYRVAMQEFRDHGYYNSWRQAAHNAAWVLIELDQLAEASEILDGSSVDEDDDPLSELAIAHRLLSAMISVRRGEEPQIGDLMDLVSSDQLPDHMAAWVGALSSLVAAQQGHVELAMTIAEQATVKALNGGDVRVTRLAHGAYQQAVMVLQATRQGAH